VSREARDVEVGEAGSALIHDYTDKLWELVQVFRGSNATVMVLADTHGQAEEAEVIKSMLVEQGIEVAYTPAIITETGHTTAGVMIWTNPNVLEVRNQTEIIGGRILRIGVEDIATEEEWAVYGVYMPVRGAHDTAQDVEETWSALRKQVNEETVVRTAVGGDLNAETHEWRQERNARRTPSDEHLDEMMEESELTALAEGSTHRSGTQIDNWLMTPAAAREMGACWVLPGVCGKDHDMVMVRRSEGGQEQGERRPMNSAAKAFSPESKDKAEIQKIKAYAEEAERLYLEGGGKLGEEHEGEHAEAEDIDWAEELRTFQRACTAAAEGQEWTMRRAARARRDSSAPQTALARPPRRA
jgi:exonuclease III